MDAENQKIFCQSNKLVSVDINRFHERPQNGSKNFGKGCALTLTMQSHEAIIAGRLKLTIDPFFYGKVFSGLSVSCGATSGIVRILIGGDGSSIFIGEDVSGNWDLRFWRTSSLSIGKATTGSNIRVVSDLSQIQIGKDCLISDEILVQGNDQHAIVDLQTGKIINDQIRSITIGNHVWLGRRCTIMPDVTIGDGAIVGAVALVTRDVHEYSLVAGAPAKELRKNVSWSRMPTALDDYAKQAISDFKIKGIR